MPAIIARVVSLESEPFHGWARVALELTDGRNVEMHDKHPVLGSSHSNWERSYTSTARLCRRSQTM
jgi:hypothetical protein